MPWPPVNHNDVQQAVTELRAYAPLLQWSDVPDDGITDAGPAIQALYDAGLPLRLNPTGTYLINTPVFFDRQGAAGAYGRYEFDLSGATIIAGPLLPTCSAFATRNAYTRWAFFTNTLRSAWNTGTNVVTVDESTKASSLPYSSTFGSLMPMVFRNFTFKGRAGEYDGNAGFVFGNRCSHRIENFTKLGAFCILSWFDYADSQVMIQGQGRPERYDGTGNDAVDTTAEAMMHQVAQGDNVYIEACKGGRIALLRRNRGAMVSTCLGKLTFSECSGVTVVGQHMESQIADDTEVRIVHSEVTFVGCLLYRRPSSGPNIEIEDSDTEMCSVVSLIDCQQVTFWGGDGPSGSDMRNNVWGPAVDILDATASTKVTFRGWHAKFASVNLPGVRRNAAARPIAASGESGLAPALVTNAALALMASGSFQFAKIHGTWKVISPDGSDLVAVTPVPSPVVSGTSTAATSTTWLGSGTLTSGTVYTYYVGAVDAAGGVTATQSFEVTAGTTGVARISVSGVSNCHLIVWRGTGAAATPDRYQRIIPGALNQLHTFDVGAYIDGAAWITTGIPARPGSATSAARLLVGGSTVTPV